MSSTGRLRLWARLPELKAGTVPTDESLFRKMTWRAETSACEDVPGDDELCRCKPMRASGVSDGDGHVSFLPAGPELRITLPRDASESDEVDATCTKDGEELAATPPMLWHGVDILPFQQDGAIVVESSGCYDAQGDITEECRTNLDRFIRMPFRGKGELVDSVPGLLEARTRVRWEVCCGCGKPEREEFEGEDDPCGDSSEQQGLLAVAVAHSDTLRADLKQRLERFKSNRAEAETYRSDFQLVSNSCAGWDIAMALLTALIGGAGAPQGAGAVSAADEAARGAAAAFTQILELLEKLAEQDPQVILSGVEGAEVDLLGVEGFTFGSLWGPASQIYQLVSDAQNPSSIANMRSRLEDCAGTPLVSDLVYDDARLFLDLSEAAARELPGIQKLTTQIQQADTTTYERWVAWYNACLEEAKCRETDPAVCAPSP